MMWLWLQSLVLIALTFSVGLWLGHVVSILTKGAARPEPAAVAAFEDREPYRPYHGYDNQPEPAVAEAPPPPPPPPLPVAPPRRIKPPLLFPINQFGIVTVTQAPAI
ncbi:hypothetical protein ABAC460_15645 [Asticcacaulis sp. AC460]|uniref:hypothetical protein n=1 Tax=Asticcacaulis sp. AC460 TaxID=1282360 RepID=UPI0003C3FDE8|nr:hypothetical protein [Asticcacaulis sp. AC460]ESQ88465.1 hypothetical protein ABAC460_15645 [Asticcacaulis sp. AC460]